MREIPNINNATDIANSIAPDVVKSLSVTIENIVTAIVATVVIAAAIKIN